jgi:hypothetical protein
VIPELPVFEILACENNCSVDLGEGKTCDICDNVFLPATERKGQLLAPERPSTVYFPIRERLQRLFPVYVHLLFYSCIVYVHLLFYYCIAYVHLVFYICSPHVSYVYFTCLFRVLRIQAPPFRYE